MAGRIAKSQYFWPKDRKEKYQETKYTNRKRLTKWVLKIDSTTRDLQETHVKCNDIVRLKFNK